MVVRAISVAILTRTSKPNQNQNHSGATMHAAGVESIAIITIKNQVCISTNWPWQSNKKTRTYIDTTINAFTVPCLWGAKKSGSNRPAKYTSRPCLAPSISNVAAVVVTL